MSGDDMLQGVVDYPTAGFKYYVVSDSLTPVINLRGNKPPVVQEFTAALVYEHTFPFPSGGRLVSRQHRRRNEEERRRPRTYGLRATYRFAD